LSRSALILGMWQSASRRTSRHSRSPSNKTSGKVICAHALPLRDASGMRRLDRRSGAGDERFNLGEGKWGGRVRDCEHLAPGVSLDDAPAAGRLGHIAKRDAHLGACPPPDEP
jgi:hypothetical protein